MEKELTGFLSNPPAFTCVQVPMHTPFYVNSERVREREVEDCEEKCDRIRAAIETTICMYM